MEYEGGVVFQITDVKRFLISVRRLREKGYSVILDEKPRILHKSTGEVIPLIEENGMFLIEAWFKASGFTRQGK